MSKKETRRQAFNRIRNGSGVTEQDFTGEIAATKPRLRRVAIIAQIENAVASGEDVRPILEAARKDPSDIVLFGAVRTYERLCANPPGFNERLPALQAREMGNDDLFLGYTPELPSAMVISRTLSPGPFGHNPIDIGALGGVLDTDGNPAH